MKVQSPRVGPPGKDPHSRTTALRRKRARLRAEDVPEQTLARRARSGKQLCDVARRASPASGRRCIRSACCLAVAVDSGRSEIPSTCALSLLLAVGRRARTDGRAACSTPLGEPSPSLSYTPWPSGVSFTRQNRTFRPPWGRRRPAAHFGATFRRRRPPPFAHRKK